MKIKYPAEKTVSVWVGTFPSKDAFDRCVAESVTPALSLETDIASICEIGFEPAEVVMRELLDGFSGSDTFMERAAAVAASSGLTAANAALVCYNLECIDAPADWGGLRFLGNFSEQAVA